MFQRVRFVRSLVGRILLLILFLLLPVDRAGVLTQIREIAEDICSLIAGSSSPPSPPPDIEKPPEILSTSNLCHHERNLSYPIIRASICRDKVVGSSLSLSPPSPLLSSCLGERKPGRGEETLGPYGKQRNDDSNKGVMTVMDGIDNSPPCSSPLSKQF